MSTVPHDISDLHLAPVVLALDARLEQLGQLTLEELNFRVVLESDSPAWTADQREGGLLEAVQHFVDCHSWVLSWDIRGIRLTHAEHTLVLGAPPTFAKFLAGASDAAGSRAEA